MTNAPHKTVHWLGGTSCFILLGYSFATLLVSVVMLRARVFNRVTAITGIATHGLDLAHILIGSFLPAAGNMLMFVAGPLYLVWFPLMGSRLYRIRQAEA